MNANFSTNECPSASAVAALLTTCANAGIAGGSVYDALVGIAAAEADLVLLTRDTRAIAIYNALHINFEVVRD